MEEKRWVKEAKEQEKPKSLSNLCKLTASKFGIDEKKESYNQFINSCSIIAKEKGLNSEEKILGYFMEKSPFKKVREKTSSDNPGSAMLEANEIEVLKQFASHPGHIEYAGLIDFSPRGLERTVVQKGKEHISKLDHVKEITDVLQNIDFEVIFHTHPKSEIKYPTPLDINYAIHTWLKPTGNLKKHYIIFKDGSAVSIEFKDPKSLNENFLKIYTDPEDREKHLWNLFNEASTITEKEKKEKIISGYLPTLMEGKRYEEFKRQWKKKLKMIGIDFRPIDLITEAFPVKEP